MSFPMKMGRGSVSNASSGASAPLPWNDTSRQHPIPGFFGRVFRRPRRRSFAARVLYPSGVRAEW